MASPVEGLDNKVTILDPATGITWNYQGCADPRCNVPNDVNEDEFRTLLTRMSPDDMLTILTLPIGGTIASALVNSVFVTDESDIHLAASP